MTDTVPDTAGELLAMQEDAVPPQVQRALDMLDSANLTMADTLTLATRIIRLHRRFHEQEVDQILDEGAPDRHRGENLAQWAIDAHKLKMAECLLESVEVDDDPEP